MKVEDVIVGFIYKYRDIRVQAAGTPGAIFLTFVDMVGRSNLTPEIAADLVLEWPDKALAGKLANYIDLKSTTPDSYDRDKLKFDLSDEAGQYQKVTERQRFSWVDAQESRSMNRLPPGGCKQPSFVDMRFIDFIAIAPDIQKIVDYCHIASCTVEDLIGGHQLMAQVETAFKEAPDQAFRGAFSVTDGKLDFNCTTKGVSFEQVKEGLTKLRDEIQRQLDHAKDCPHYKP